MLFLHLLLDIPILYNETENLDWKQGWICVCIKCFNGHVSKGRKTQNWWSNFISNC